MESILVSRKAKVVALSLLIACSGMGNTAFATPSLPGKTGVQVTGVAATAHTQSSSAGFQVDYFHAEKSSRTYALGLKNGLRVSFDLDSSTVTLTDVAGRQKTFPLNQALLQSTGGNSQEAEELYDQLSQSIDSAKADAIMAYAGPAGTSANAGVSTVSPGMSPQFLPPPRGTIGFGDDDGSLWATPTGGSCFPIPGFCNQWEGGLSNWGQYNDWWGSTFGDPPPTTQPPRPDGCPPNDVDCVVHEHDRQVACDALVWDNVSMAGSAVLTAGACTAAVETAGLATVACSGAATGLVVSVHNLNKHRRQCHTPYPGH